MNELAKAVLVFVLSTAAAVWLLGAALHMWPDAGQLAYGNPLPYLKVKFDRPVNAVKFWVEDFGGVPYERVWLYVNDQLAASGGPGTDATAKCGDEVAAVVKYHSGTKKLEGRILCTQPIKASDGGEVKRAIRLIQVTQAYRAMTGDMDQTGLPVRFDGRCDIGHYGIGHVSVTAVAVRPDVMICAGVSCGASYTFSRSIGIGTYRWIVPIDVFKAPDAPASQLLGGGRGVIDIYVTYSWYYGSHGDAYHLYVYVNGTLVATCIKETAVSRVSRSWTEYKEPNATGVYLFRLIAELPDGTKKVLDGNLVLYEHNDGSFGFRFTLNPVEDPSPQDTEMASPLALIFKDENYRSYYAAVDLRFAEEESYNGPLTRFWMKVWTPDSEYRSILQKALSQLTDIEFNIPRIAVNKTGEYSVYHTRIGRQGRSVTLSFKALSISSLGAVYANAVLPIDIKLPPPVLPRNATRTYIFGYS